MKKSVLVFLLFFIFSNFLIAQNDNFVLGVVIDKASKKPIPFASVYWKGLKNGVISNEDGSFKLFSEKSTNEDHLIISCIGYQSIEISSKNISLNQLTKIELEEKIFDIDEVVIKDKKLKVPTARKIVLSAIDQILNNYPTTPFMLEGYYRDYMLIDSNYVNLFESLVEVEDRGFSHIDYENTKIRQIYGRINNDCSYDSTKIMSYSDESLKRLPSAEIRFAGGNELSLLRLTNPIRNFNLNTIDFINEFRKDFLENHYCTVDEIFFENKKPVYIIRFKYYDKEKKKETVLEKALINKKIEVLDQNRIKTIKKSTQKFKAEGTIYIDRESYAIRKIHYVLYLDDIKYDQFKGWELNLEYKPIGNKNYLHYISYNNVFEMPNYHDSVYFNLKNTFVNPELNRITLEFNNEIQQLIPKDYKNIRIKFQGSKVNYQDAVKDEYDPQYLHLNFDSKIFKKAFANFSAHTANELEVKLTKKLYDVKGNKLYDYKSILGYQYREFFVNKVSTVFVPLLPEECIDKWQSLFDNKSLDIDNSKEVFLNSPLLK